MDEQIIIGLFTIGGTLVGGLIGGLFSVKAAKIGYKKESMEKDIRKLSFIVQMEVRMLIVFFYCSGCSYNSF